MPNQFKSKAFTTKDTKDTKVKIEETVIASLQFRIELHTDRDIQKQSLTVHVMERARQRGVS
jgi:hypothetical protein